MVNFSGTLWEFGTIVVKMTVLSVNFAYLAGKSLLLEAQA